MKTLTRGRMWLFAVGQFGWALLSGLIGSWLVYFYQPDTASVAAGQVPLIPQGRVVFGALTIIGLITAFGRVFDAVTDPLLASLSDTCRSKNGRRIPFLTYSAVPLAVITVLVFCAPFSPGSGTNVVWLFVLIALYYLCITAYCTPYTALYSELGHTGKERMALSTAISLTFIAGTAAAYAAPALWGIFEPSLGRIPAMRLSFALLACAAVVCLFFPVLFIRERDYVEVQPVQTSAFSSFAKTLGNRDFRIFVGSDICYWLGLTMFQTGLPFFITVLMKLPEGMFTPMFVGMTAMSLVFYIPVNALTRKIGKKNMVITAFILFSVVFAFTSVTGTALGIPPIIQGIIVVIAGSLPMAIFGILPQAIVADIAEYDTGRTGESRQGMFFAVRTFCFKLGQSAAMLIFTSLATIGAGTGTGYRIVAGLSAVLCISGGIVLAFFDEKKISAGITNA